MDPHDDSHSYLSHLDSEHKRLELLSQNVANRFANASDVGWERRDRPQIAAQLSALKDELSRHIEEEDFGGCLDEAVARVPSLSESARKIFQENDELKRQLRLVMNLVESGSRADAEISFEKFSADLRLHEQHEHELATRGLKRLPRE